MLKGNLVCRNRVFKSLWGAIATALITTTISGYALAQGTNKGSTAEGDGPNAAKPISQIGKLSRPGSLTPASSTQLVNSADTVVNPQAFDGQSDAASANPLVQVAEDSLALKNGDRLTGRILKFDGKTLLLRTEYAGDLSVKWEAVNGFTSTEKLYLDLRDGQTIVGTVGSSTDGQISVRTAEAGVVTISREAITGVRSDAADSTGSAVAKTLKKGADVAKDVAKTTVDVVKDAVDVKASDSPSGLLSGWDGNFDVGLSLAGGNTNAVNFFLNVDSSRDTPDDRISLFATRNYNWNSVRDESATTADSFRGGLRYDWKIRERTSFFGFGQAETNDVQGLDFRFTFGGGANRRLINRERKKLDVFAGIAFTREYLESDFFFDPRFDPDFDTDDLSKSSIELLFGDEYTWRITDRARLKQRAEFFPNLTDFGEFRLNFDTIFTYDLTRRIAWQNTFNYRLFTNAPPGFDNSDVLFTTGIRFKFGR